MLITNIILTLTNILSLTHFKIILDLFEMLFGLKINYTKSHDFKLGAISDTQINVTSSILKCQIGSFPLSYLGVPLKTSKLDKIDFLSLIGKVRCHMSSWKRRHVASNINILYVFLSSTKMGDQQNRQNSTNFPKDR